MATGNYRVALAFFTRAAAHDSWPGYRTAIAIANASIVNGQGIDALNRGDYDGAIGYFKDAIRYVPDWQPYRGNLEIALAGQANALGYEASKNRRWALAESYYLQAVKHDPTYQGYRNNLAKARANLENDQGTDDYKRGKYDAAASHFEEAARYWPDPAFRNNIALARAELANARGVEAARRNEYDDAIRYFSAAASYDTSTKAVYRNNVAMITAIKANALGTDAWRSGDYDTALRSYQQAAAADPKWHGYRANVAMVRTKLSAIPLTPSCACLVLGQGAILEFDVRHASPAVVAREMTRLKQLMASSGHAYNESIDFHKYEFVIGIAESTNEFADFHRVVMDEFSNGRFTATHQAAYNALQGSFKYLGCHSNGAMICLAALENHRIRAQHVTLYGPQVTLETLMMWNKLVTDGYVNSIEMIVNESDPVTGISLLAGTGGAALSTAAFFRPDILRHFLTLATPAISVRIFGCGTGAPNLGCHKMAAYKWALCKPVPSHVVVPGTTVNGRGTTEPPSPCSS